MDAAIQRPWRQSSQVLPAFSNFFFLTNLEGVKALGAPGFSSRRPFRMRSVISGVTTRSVAGPHEDFCLGLGYDDLLGNDSRMRRRLYRVSGCGMSSGGRSMLDNLRCLMHRRNRRRFRFGGNLRFFGCSFLFRPCRLGMRRHSRHCSFSSLIRRRDFARKRFGRQRFRYRLGSSLFHQLSRFPVIVFAALARR